MKYDVDYLYFLNLDPQKLVKNQTIFFITADYDIPAICLRKNLKESLELVETRLLKEINVFDTWWYFGIKLKHISSSKDLLKRLRMSIAARTYIKKYRFLSTVLGIYFFRHEDNKQNNYMILGPESLFVKDPLNPTSYMTVDFSFPNGQEPNECDLKRIITEVYS